MLIPPCPSDRTLQQAVADELAADTHVNAAHIGVIAEDGVITLTGNAATYLECQAAERAVFRVQDVLGVVNHLQVEVASPRPHGDPEIARAAAHALEVHPLVPEHAAQIKVEQGVVTLSGEVDWTYQAQAAEAAIQGLTGVVQVINRMTVTPRLELAASARPLE
jgi:osmotically-inducible protein OsmY